jgi:hypothetical protein
MAAKDLVTFDTAVGLRCSAASANIAARQVLAALGQDQALLRRGGRRIVSMGWQGMIRNTRQGQSPFRGLAVGLYDKVGTPHITEPGYVCSTCSQANGQ